MGNPGGARGPNFGAGGGGGFTSAGTASDGSNNPGPGGNGITLSISGSSAGYAGGGGGGGACGPFRGSFTGGTATHGGGAGAPADGSNLPTYRGDSGTMGPVVEVVVQEDLIVLNQFIQRCRWFKTWW